MQTGSGLPMLVPGGAGGVPVLPVTHPQPGLRMPVAVSASAPTSHTSSLTSIPGTSSLGAVTGSSINNTQYTILTTMTT